ncbi:MAG: endolytic transglycosylase MltG [Myxococcales bacterium]|nr:endolytic transglycosylase MltG [Myxococcales bacterium]
MSKRSFRIAGGIVVGTLILLTVAGFYAYGIAKAYPHEPHKGEGMEISVEIERGMSFPKIAERLASAGVIDKPRWFRFYGMRRGVTTKVRSGKYLLRDDMTPKAVIDTLLEGVKEVTARITIQEGLNMLEVFALYEEAGIADAQELEGLARDLEFLENHGIAGETIDGYLFPDTYHFRVPSAPGLVLETMVKQHRVVWDRLKRANGDAFAKVRKKLEWSEREFLIMASIVEKEAVSAEERPRIAQVFMNRLTSPKFVPHRLDTDPTIRYGCMVPTRKSAACQAWDKSDRLHRKQLDDADNPYNTYEHEGLPPGPICSPGASAMKAVMTPDGSGYFFFVAMDARTHAFAKSRVEHERNVDKYIRNR